MTMWQRKEIWDKLTEPWDLIIIGGGITGAGILREATRLGLRALLVEQQDFAWGTSSRSSKLVHGGLRYLRQGRVGLTRASVSEREQLLAQGPGLIRPLGFLWATFKGDRPGRWLFEAGLSVYDLLAWQWDHDYHDAADFHMLAPHIDRRQLTGGFTYEDAKTDDARLVFRLLQEAVLDGGTALNYARAETLLVEAGTVSGVRLRDRLTATTADIYGRVVINATGAWADRLRTHVDGRERIRPLRGSHLIFPNWRLPVAQAISFPHPLDGRPVFIFPWEGITLVGTTDVDHEQPLDLEPRISGMETAYLLAAVAAYFPSLAIGVDDILSTFAGVRPVIGTGSADPSRESRDHVVWQEKGLLTVTGGKLTTFRLIALDALEAVRARLPEMAKPAVKEPVLAPVAGPLPGASGLDERAQQRLWGRYGRRAPEVVAAAQPGELTPIEQTNYLWAELRWAAYAEAVVHLDDLLLRRVRVGLLLPEGGAALQERIGAICREELGWDEQRWQEEWSRYRDLWKCCYRPPAEDEVPDWQAMLATPPQPVPPLTFRRLAPAGAFLSLGLLLIYLYRKQWSVREAGS